MRIFSGIQPTGRKHLGNYIGAIRQYVEGQDRGDPAIYCIVDLHATTVAYDPAELRERVFDTGALLIAAGLDPDRCVLFRQSDVGEHTELTWLLSAVTAWGDLNRMTQFKEKSAKQRELVSAGLFFYPVLMAADVLVVPDGRYPEVGARVMDLQNPEAKMSTTGGSEQGTVYVLDEPAVVTKKLKSAVTDSGAEVVRAPDKGGISNLIEILAAVRGSAPEEVEREFDGSGYGAFKSSVADAVVEYLAPVRERYHELRRDEAALEATLAAGADKARAIAVPVLADVHEAMAVGAPR